MKFLKLLVAPALVLFLAGPALADDLQIGIDPTPDPPSFTVYDITTGINGTFSWQTCADPGPGGSGIEGGSGCLYFYNASDTTISYLSLTFTVPATEPSEDPTAWTGITCVVFDSSFSAGSCPTGNVLGDTVTLDFYGGTGIAPGMYFYISEGTGGVGISPGDMPITGVTVPSHDPNTLVLLLAGMSMLAVAGIRRTA